MFANITWANYIMFLAALVIVYYIYVGVRYYHSELKLLILKTKKIGRFSAKRHNELQNSLDQGFQSQGNQQDLYDMQRRHMPSPEDVDDTFEKVQELKLQLKAVIEKATSKNYIKEEFILSLQIVLRKYEFLKGSPFVVAINNLIVSECEKYGYIKLNAEERVMLWSE